MDSLVNDMIMPKVSGGEALMQTVTQLLHVPDIPRVGEK
jgi:hypothetical protein